MDLAKIIVRAVFTALLTSIILVFLARPSNAPLFVLLFTLGVGAVDVLASVGAEKLRDKLNSDKRPDRRRKRK